MSMKFGIHNPSWVYGPDPTEAFEGVKARAQWAENHGFVWFSVMDHMIQIGGVGAPDEPFMEGWTVLSGLAAVTSRIRLATLATSVGYRNPAHLAKIATSVDLISRGRLTLGIGAGYLETEYRQYGWEFPARPAVRIRQMEEAVRLILALWTERRTTLPRQIFSRRGRDPRAETGSEAAATGVDRRRRRAAYLACGRPPGRRLQCRR
jgi:alkanesulfonate monooxygenase SsuD/methylene tetrahydromethanopterin reductase-like flavin-dependent oxidoreductase (luciferase family)